MREFLEQQSTEVAEYDELLVRRLIEKAWFIMSSLRWSSNPGRRWMWRGKWNKMYGNSVLNGEKGSKKERKACEAVLQENNIDYIIIDKSKMIPDYYEKMGYSFIGETEHYVVVYERV